MFRKKGSSMQKYVFVLILLLVFMYNAQLLAQSGVSRSNLQKDADEPEDVFGMPLEELMEVEIVSVATLTHTKPRLIPAAITTITNKQIRESGARSMYELLDIYVPNLQWSRHHWENDVLGLRGIINDRNDKYLLLVNGRYMNDRTHYGVVSELDMVTLNDIHHIDVIRGPGSAMYGPGAISMVINIITYNSDTFQGLEVTGRLGSIEEFYSGELKYGRKDKDGDGGLFVYSGFGKYIGASKYDAPQIYAFFLPPTGGAAPAFAIPGDGTHAGHPMTDTYMNRDNADALLPSMKLYAQYKKDNWDFWARLTRGGKQYAWAPESIARSPIGFGDIQFWQRFGNNYPPYIRPNFYTYLQLTTYLGYKWEVAEDLDVDFAWSYQSITNVQEREIRYGVNYREDNYYAKILFKWRPNDRHKVAFGTEYLYNDLGLLGWNGLGWKPPQSHGSWGGTVQYPFMNPNVQIWGWNVLMPSWRTELWSFLGEWQWNVNDRWTAFVGGRLDDHTFTARMFSPRAALVHTPTEKDTYKLMFTRSVRTNFEDEMKYEWDNTHRNSDPEKLSAWELRYERKHDENLDFAVSAYHHKLDAITWDDGAKKTTNMGSYGSWGVEGELIYHTDKTRFTLSHGYTKLIWMKLLPGTTTHISAMPYNYGDDLTNWSNHNTKALYKYKITDKLDFDASLRIYWGFPGLRAYNEYRPYARTVGSNIVSKGWNRTYRGSYFLDLGFNYEYNENLSFNVTGYNLLGVFNRDFNKRNYIETGSTGSDFRSHAPAIGISMLYKF